MNAPHGSREGTAWLVLDWHRQVVGGIVDPGVREIVVSMGRGGGKTSFSAVLLSAFVAGPLQSKNAEIVLLGTTLDVARLAFRTALSIVRDLPNFERSRYSIQDNVQRCEIVNRELSIRVKCMAAHANRLHGLMPNFVLADEPAQWSTNQTRHMRAALETSLGKRENAKLLTIGTRGIDPRHWWNQLVDHDRDGVVRIVHYAPDELAWDSWAAVKRAIPGIDDLPTLKRQVEAELVAAREDPNLLPQFRALRLNQGVLEITDEVICTREQWASKERDDTLAMGPMVWGFDLSSAMDLTAIVAYWPATGRLEAIAGVCAEPGLDERASRRGADVAWLRDCIREGSLIADCGGEVIDVGAMLDVARNRWGDPDLIVGDRYRARELREALRSSKIPPCDLVDEPAHEHTEVSVRSKTITLAKRPRIWL